MSADNNPAATLAELDQKREELEFKLANVKGQLEKAAAHRIATGEYADADWYRRAKAVQRYTGIEHQQLLRQISAIKRTQREVNARSFDACFVDAARALLPPDEFRRLYDAARQAASP